jgi:hypothetical protein
MTMTSEGKKGTKHKEEVEKRQRQLAQCSSLLEESMTKLGMFTKQKKECELLFSVCEGLYQEVDKLSKKAPAEPITELVCGELNQVITDTKRLAADDAYVQRLKTFVPAGENPPHRDAVVVLQLVLKGLQRFRDAHRASSTAERSRRLSIATVEAALTLWLEQESDYIVEDVLEDFMEEDPASEWITGEYGSKHFNFERLDQRDDISEWFPVGRGDDVDAAIPGDNETASEQSE